jgi:hypothetical protein
MGFDKFNASRTRRMMARDNRPAKRRFDRYDAIGLILVGFIALWIAHFLLSAPLPTVP